MQTSSLYRTKLKKLPKKVVIHIHMLKGRPKLILSHTFFRLDILSWREDDSNRDARFIGTHELNVCSIVWSTCHIHRL